MSADSPEGGFPVFDHQSAVLTINEASFRKLQLDIAATQADARAWSDYTEAYRLAITEENANAGHTYDDARLRLIQFILENSDIYGLGLDELSQDVPRSDELTTIPTDDEPEAADAREWLEYKMVEGPVCIVVERTPVIKRARLDLEHSGDTLTTDIDVTAVCLDNTQIALGFSQQVPALATATFRGIVEYGCAADSSQEKQEVDLYSVNTQDEDFENKSAKLDEYLRRIIESSLWLDANDLGHLKE